MKPKVAFICLGNSCRSIMAEALARHLFGDRLDAVSAGISPLGFIAPETTRVLAEMGVATAGLRSQGLEEIDLRDCRRIVNLSGYSLESLIPGPLTGRLLHWAVPDPYGCSLDVYRQARDLIRRRLLEDLVPHLT
jgi:protein-tyrosine-phosphatase